MNDSDKADFPAIKKQAQTVLIEHCSLQNLVEIIRRQEDLEEIKEAYRRFREEQNK